MDDNVSMYPQPGNDAHHTTFRDALSDLDVVVDVDGTIWIRDTVLKRHVLILDGDTRTIVATLTEAIALSEQIVRNRGKNRLRSV